MLEAVKNELIKEIEGQFTLPRQISVTQWCEENIVLSSLQTDTPGNYSTRLTPYIRDVLEDFKNPDVETETLCFGSQTAKTQAMMSGLAWSLTNNPRPGLWVMPNKDLAGSFSESRLQPIFEDCPELMERKHSDRYKWKKLSMEFTGAILALIGSNSPANLASRPVGLLIMDETDKFAEASKKEANAVDLAEQRTRTFATPKIFKTSTPSNADAIIWVSFMLGSMHRFFLPCPECDNEVVLVFNPERSAMPRLKGREATLRWDPDARGPDGWDLPRVEATTHFECPHCQGKIWEKSKTQMLRRGVWRATNPSPEPRHISRHLPTFYAPWRKSAWGRLAVEFLQAKNSVDGLKGYINGVLAEPDIGQFEGGSGGRTEAVVTGDKPLAETVRIMAIDRQKDHHFFVVREFMKGGDSRLVEWGKVITEDDLEDVRIRLKVAPDLTGIDSGFEAATVYQECARFGWFAIRGDGKESFTTRDSKNRPVQVPHITRQFDPFLGTKFQGKTTIAELRWSNPTIKDILAKLRDSEKSPVKWEVPEEYATEEYWRQLDGEIKKRDFNAKTGKPVYTWQKRSRHWPNHLLDCEAMILAIAIKIKLLKTSGK